jgi:hypothetical protein
MTTTRQELAKGNNRSAAGRLTRVSRQPLSANLPRFVCLMRSAMRLVRGYMEAFGLNKDELYTVCTKNPAKVVGLELN